MYASRNFRTKKQFKEAVAAGEKIEVFQPGGYFPTPKEFLVGSGVTATCVVEGPHYPNPHTFYASVTVVDGIVTKIK